MQTIIYILQELLLSLDIMFLLVTGVFIKNSYKIVNLLTLITLVFVTALVLNQSNDVVKILIGLICRPIAYK